MDCINIICRLDEQDDFTLNSKHLDVNFYKKDKLHYTFWDNIKRHSLLEYPLGISSVGIDLIYISLFVFYADRLIKREIYPDAWTRKIKLYIPVLSINKWNINKELCEKMITYLSGDEWTLEFRQRKSSDKELKSITKQKKLIEYENGFERICMLSGGLDSYIGAIDILENDKKAFFVGHSGGGKGVYTYQNLVKKTLKEKYNIDDSSFFNFYAAPINGDEDTTRSRSFMFFAHAIALSTSFYKCKELIIPENGLISLNIPLTNSRLGSSSTRTTHPYYMGLFQELINNLGIDLKLINPYQFKTKGEMINDCKNKNFLEQNIDKTMSCSHPDIGRYEGERSSSHCGTCLPCIIRRASIMKGNIPDTSTYRDLSFKSGITAKSNLNTYQLAIKKYKDTLELNHIFHIQKSGPLVNNLKAFSDLYKKGMLEIIDLINIYK